MKKLAVAIVVLAALTVGLPFLGGFIAKQQLNNVVRVLNDNPGYAASVSDYKRTWWKTSATLNLVIDIPEPNGAVPISIDVPVQLSVGHGPVLPDLGYGFGWFSYRVSVAQEQSQYFRQHVTAFDVSELFQISGYMSILGAATINSRSEPFIFASKQMDVSVGATAFVGAITLSGLLEYKGTIGEIVVSLVDGGTVTMAASTLTVNSDYGRLLAGTNLMPSRMAYAISNIEVASSGTVSTLEEIDVNAEVSLSDDNSVVDFSMGVHSTNGIIGREDYSNFSLELTYNRVSVILFDAYKKMIENSVGKGAENVNPASVFTAEVVQDFLQHKPSMGFNTLKVDLFDGSIAGDFYIDFQPVPNVDAELIIENPVLLLPGIKANMNVLIGKTLAMRLAKKQAEAAVENQIAVQQASGGRASLTAKQKAELVIENAESTLGMLLEQKFIVEDAGDYKSAFVLDRGQTQINGNMVSLPLAAMLSAD